MGLKLFLIFGVLQFTNMQVNAYPPPYEVINITNGDSKCHFDCVNINVISELKLQHEMFTKMSSTTKSLLNTSITPPDENIHIFPILETLRDNMMLMEIYYEAGLAPFHPKREFFRVPLELATLLEKFAQSSTVVLNFTKILFYDEHINKHYLEDIKEIFDTKVMKMHSRNNTNVSKDSLYRWMSANLKGRKPEKENLWTPRLRNFHAFALEFSSCWDIWMHIPRNIVKHTFPHFVFNLYRRHEKLPPLPNAENSTLSSHNDSEIYIDVFNFVEVIGYFNNPRKGYEAIRVPFKFTDFALAVLLPYQNQNFSLFLDFTPEDYAELLDGIRKKEEYVHYVIPVLDLPMVSINENGTRINSGEPIFCPTVQPHENKEKDKPIPRPFIVNRPFVLVHYHERTNFVLWQGLIRNPASKEYTFRRFMNHENDRGKDFERRFIF